jgi:hypothetical protein
MRTPARINTPDDVVDVLLRRLAQEVAANHQPHPHNPARCTNLRCTTEVYPCSAARDAARALDACRARTQPTPTAPAQALRQVRGWFEPTRATVADPAAATSAWPLPHRRPPATLQSA